jgi:hypothetical protein
MRGAPSNAEPRISAGFHPLTSLEFLLRRWRIHQNEIGKSGARVLRVSRGFFALLHAAVAACDATLSATNDDSIIIPGHGKPVSNKAELKEFRDMLAAIRDHVAKLKKDGKTRDEAVAAKPTAAFDAKWGQFVIDPGFFTRLVYEGV